MKTRKSTLKKMQIEKSTSEGKKAFTQEILKCPCSNKGCPAIFIGSSALLNHLEYECSYFESNASLKFKKIINESEIGRSNLTRLLINLAPSTPGLESWDKSFNPEKMMTNYSVQTKKPDRFPRATVFKKLDPIRELDEPDIELGQVPMKSYLCCCFTSTKSKIAKTFIAYRMSSGFNIYIKELYGYINKKLEGHKDHITEIKFFKNDREEGHLASSSYDYTTIIWSVDSFNFLYKLEYNSWVLSSTFPSFRKANFSLAILVGGYYKKNPIKVYNLINGSYQYDIEVNENLSSEICESYVEEENNKFYLFVGSDNCEKPKLVWYDFKTKTQLGSFPAGSNITSIIVDFINKNLNLYYCDSVGTIKQVDLQNNKILVDFKTYSPIIDMLIWDQEYLVVCGSPKDNSIRIFTRVKTRLVKSFDNIHSKVVCNIFKTFHSHNGMCIVTVGGDRKFKIQKLF